jgi:hypothetical protein
VLAQALCQKGYIKTREDTLPVPKIGAEHWHSTTSLQPGCPAPPSPAATRSSRNATAASDGRRPAGQHGRSVVEKAACQTATTVAYIALRNQRPVRQSLAPTLQSVLWLLLLHLLLQ